MVEVCHFSRNSSNSPGGLIHKSAKVGRIIASRIEGRGDGRLIGRHAILVTRNASVWIAARHQRATIRTAQGIPSYRGGQRQPFLCQPVDVRRIQVWIAAAP